MDERTLNDLLECSVCLERLDTSSKVLPCQHTFCRKCLEEIVTSHKELRCPECRILVDIKIDELPPNVLLMRILEGMKNSSHNQHNNTKSPRNINNTGLNNFDNHASPRTVANNPNSIRASNKQNISTGRIVPHAFALYDYVSTDTGDLNFKKSDIILLKKKINSNWFIGEVNGREGAFPIHYVQVIVPLPVPQCIALYDFKMGPNEEEGCLTFKKNTIVHVLRRVDQNWAEGRIGSSIGIFPIAFVEMNHLAKQLLESGAAPQYSAPRGLPPVPFETNSNDSSSTTTTSPNSTCSSNTSSQSAPSSPTSNSNSPQHNQPIIRTREMKDKRHSLNSITANASLSVIGSNRHSAEILSVPDPVETTSGHTSINIQASDNNKPIGNGGTTVRQQEQPQQSHQSHKTSRANVFKTNENQNVPSLPWAYFALYPYKPRKSDELELKKGSVYLVTSRCADGWYKGTNFAEKSGVFPGNYVTPLRSRDHQQINNQWKHLHNAGNHTQQQTTQLATNSNSEEFNSHTTQTMHPPELPPRSNVTPSASVWTKPLGQHVEAFFSRKSSHGQQKNDMAVSNDLSKTACLNSTVNSPKEVLSQQNSQSSSSKEKDKKESGSSAVSLMKRLTNKKRAKSPQPSQNITYSMDNPVFEDSSAIPSSSKHSISMSHPVHVRSGSCPSQLLQSLPVEMPGTSASSVDPNSVFGSQRVKGHKERPSLQGVRQVGEHIGRMRNIEIGTAHTQNIGNGPAVLSLQSKSTGISSNKQKAAPQTQPGNNSSNISHRKSHSLDANIITAQLANNSPSNKSHGIIPSERRFRCIVSYPPNSEIELELNVGDIVYVHRKQKNGWYKGTHARANKTGLFPASFVEPDI